VLTAAAFVPGAPLLVPALAGPGAIDVVDLRTAVLEVTRRLSGAAQRWVAIGVGDPDTADLTRGTFAGFGVDEVVSLRPDGGAEPASAVMATSMLVAGWLRGQVAPSALVCPSPVEVSTTARECARIGADLGARIADSADAIGLLVVADGSFGLSAGAPGGEIVGAGVVGDRVDAAVAAADLDAVAALGETEAAEAGIEGRAAWQVAAAVWRTAATGRCSPETLYRASPFGVGYQVTWWGLRP